MRPLTVSTPPPLLRAAPWLGLAGGCALIALDLALAASTGMLDALSPAESTGTVVVLGLTYATFGLTIGWLLRARWSVKEQQRALAAGQRALVESEKLAALGRLAAGVAHEVRNPLGTLRASASLIAEDLDEGTDAHRAATFIRDEVDRLDGFVTALLSYARPITPELERVAFGEVAASVRELADGELTARELTLAVRDDGRRPLLIDERLVSTVLYGLVKNAAHASPSGGTITLRHHVDAGWAIIDVDDEGDGVSGEDRDQVFEPFFTTRADGTGLGLPMARRVVEAHGGELTLSPSDRGARFRISLPLEGP